MEIPLEKIINMKSFLSIFPNRREKKSSSGITRCYNTQEPKNGTNDETTFQLARDVKVNKKLLQKLQKNQKIQNHGTKEIRETTITAKLD